NDTASNGMSALVVAAHLGQSDVAKALPEAGADPNAAGAGYAALHVSATRGDLATIEALIAHRADLNPRQREGGPTLRVNSGHALDFRMKGATPFLLAARSAHLEAMRLLAAKGADTALTLDDGRTAVMVLAGRITQEGPRLTEAEAVEALKLAIQLGTPVNRADPNGDTALHVAATWRRDAVVQALADNGAALNARNSQGETPLTIALNPPAKQQGSGVSDDYLYLLKRVSTAALLRKLGAQS
ncbi:MAG TPA: ankyrin repeat domain-containing protein, partial [Phenylobacterium sp.]|nr:ankyrin repeat domain-containing protein [Phenylobacterium sp.]